MGVFWTLLNGVHICGQRCMYSKDVTYEELNKPIQVTISYNSSHFITLTILEGSGKIDLKNLLESASTAYYPIHTSLKIID